MAQHVLIFGLAGITFALLVQLTGRERSAQPPRRSADITPLHGDLLGACRRVLGFLDSPVSHSPSASLPCGCLNGYMGAGIPAALPWCVPGTGGPRYRAVLGTRGIAGTLLAGVLIDTLAKRNHPASAMLRIPIVVLPLCVPFLLGFVFSPVLGVTVACAGAMTSCWGAPWPPA